jgi:hypothetical protein
MDLYVEGSEFQKKFAEKHDGEPIADFMKELEKVRQYDDLTISFLDMFRENYFGEDNTKAEIFVGELMRQHRTHQQSIVKNLFMALKKYAECKEKHWYDDRNEAAVEWAKKATDGEFYFPCI